jgi:hypothetical protein
VVFPVIILRYAFNDKWAIAGRAEHYNDKYGVIIVTGTPGGFQTTGYSLNVDHSLTNKMKIRLEVRRLNSKDQIFAKPPGTTNNTTFISSSIAVSF